MPWNNSRLTRRPDDQRLVRAQKGDTRRPLGRAIRPVTDGASCGYLRYSVKPSAAEGTVFLRQPLWQDLQESDGPDGQVRDGRPGPHRSVDIWTFNKQHKCPDRCRNFVCADRRPDPARCECCSKPSVPTPSRLTHSHAGKPPTQRPFEGRSERRSHCGPGPSCPGHCDSDMRSIWHEDAGQ